MSDKEKSKPEIITCWRKIFDLLWLVFIQFIIILKAIFDRPFSMPKDFSV